MSPKPQASSTNTQVFVVWSSKGIDSVHATLQSASAHLATNKGKYSIESTNIQGGTIIVNAEKAATKQKGTSKTQVVKKEDEDEEEEEDDEQATKSAVAKKTKTPAEQRAANAVKPTKASDADLPDNVKALLREGGTVFEGKTVVVTGVPPTLGRKNTEKLVEAFGAHLGKSLSKKTDCVVVGNDAGPKK
jgi:NAD-dependent DNA ligase